MRSAFAAFLTRLELASMPLIVLRVRDAKPQATLIAKNFSGLIARLVQVGNRFTRRLCLLIGMLAGLLCFHDGTPVPPF